MDKTIEKIIDSGRFVVVTTGNMNDFANMVGRFALEGDVSEMQDWWEQQSEGNRLVVVLSLDENVEGAEKSFKFENGVVSFKGL